MPTPGEAQDRLINRLFASGLTLAAVLGLHGLDGEVTERVRDVVEQLDTAIGEIRHLALAALVPDGDAPPVPALPAVPAQPEPLLRLARRDDASRELCRFAVEDVFAYAIQGPDLYRIADDELWAHESDGYLLAAHTGTPFARRIGRVYYEVETDEPLYYQRA